MGTEVQSKMYLPGYYSLRDLNENTGSGSWSSCQQNNTFGRYHDFFSTRQQIDVNEGRDKQELRQTILKHEFMFRHQLNELHRLYKIQRDMMNEMRSRDLHRNLIAARTSQSSLYFSGFPLGDDKGRHLLSSLSTVDLNHGRPSISGADSIQCQFGSAIENVMHSSYGPIQNGSTLKHCEALESGCKKLQGRIFDLELPAEEYVNNEKELQGVSGVSVGRTYLLSRDHEMTGDRGGNSSIHSGVISGCKSDALSPDSYGRKPHGLNNFSEHINFKEASASASTNVLGNIIYSNERMERCFPSSFSHSGFPSLGNKFSQDFWNGKDGQVRFSNLHLETEKQQKGWSGYNFEAGQTGSDGGCLDASFCPQDLPTNSKSQKVECRNSGDFSSFPSYDLNKKESHQKKRIFGVEICERNQVASVEASHTSIQHPLVPQSHLTNSEPSSYSWKKLNTGSSQNMMTVEGHPSISTFTQSNKSSVTLMHGPEGGNKLLFSSNSRSIPITGAEASCQNELSLSSQLESKESWICHSSNGFCPLNGVSDSSSASEQFAQHVSRNRFRDLGSMVDAKFTEEKKVDAVSLNNCQNESLSQPAIVSTNGTRKQNPQGGLAWLKVVTSCNGNSSEERQGSSQMNQDSLQNNSQQFVDKTEMLRKSSFQGFVQDSLSATCALDAEHRKSDVGECSSNRKIAGISIFEKLHVSKDLATPSTPSNPTYLAPTVDGTKAHDPASPEFGKQHKLEGLKNGLINHSADSRHHIDLNLCVVEEGVEEEAKPTLSSSRNNLKIEIDLEAPVAETEMEITLGGVPLDSKLNEPVNLREDVSTKPREGMIQVAAEALVAISSSCLPQQIDDCSHDSDDSHNDPLQWFAEIISAYKSDIHNEVGSVSVDQESVNLERIFPDEMDYFEFMTLSLTETKVEECCYKPQVFENSKNESIVLKRPRRGQARRGRQRKDFQRDVLPTLSSLLKNEVTEDLQTIEGLIRATGGTWQSSLALKNTARSIGRKRRRCLEGSDSPPNVNAVCPTPPTQPPKCREVAIEETSLIGWGKRTRRPPRQRCPISSPPLSIK